MMSDISSQVLRIRAVASPRITVIVPTYNRAALFGATLDSIDSQTMAGRVETIVVDDGSSDSTVEAVSSRKMGPGGLTLIATPNRGPSAARNAGLALARSPYVTFLDSDDLIAPDKLSKQVSLFPESGQIDYVTCDWAVFEGHRDHVLRAHRNGGRAAWPVLPDFLDGHFFPNGNAVYRREICARTGPWPEKLRTYEDWAWHIAMGVAGAAGRHCPETLLFVRQHGGSRLSKDASRAKVVSDYGLYIQHVIRCLRGDAEAWPRFGSRACNLLHRAGVWHLRTGANKRGMTLMWRACRMHPRLQGKVTSALLNRVVELMGASHSIQVFDAAKRRATFMARMVRCGKSASFQ
jgi:glycosyltransferase involved in cell wall biosynthesis